MRAVFGPVTVDLEQMQPGQHACCTHAERVAREPLDGRVGPQLQESTEQKRVHRRQHIHPPANCISACTC